MNWGNVRIDQTKEQGGELRGKAKEFAVKHGLFTTDKKLFESGVGVVFDAPQWNQFLDELTSLVDKPKVDTKITEVKNFVVGVAISDGDAAQKTKLIVEKFDELFELDKPNETHKGESWRKGYMQGIKEATAVEKEQLEELIWEVISRIYSNVAQMGVPTEWNNKDFKRGALKAWESEINAIAQPKTTSMDIEKIKREFYENYSLTKGDWTNDGAYWGQVYDKEATDSIWNFFAPHLQQKEVTQTPKEASTTANKAPKKIYLQIEGENYVWDDYQAGDVTWCEDKINDTDVEYIRSDTTQPKTTSMDIEELKKVYDKSKVVILTDPDGRGRYSYIDIDGDIEKRIPLFDFFAPHLSNKSESNIDHSIDVRYETDVLKAFDKFITKWCGKHRGHLIDTDENDGQYMREKIEQLLSNKSELKVDKTCPKCGEESKKGKTDNSDNSVWCECGFCGWMWKQPALDNKTNKSELKKEAVKDALWRFAEHWNSIHDEVQITTHELEQFLVLLGYLPSNEKEVSSSGEGK